MLKSLKMSNHVISEWEIIKDKLVFTVYKNGYRPPRSKTPGVTFLNIDDQLIYENFLDDFGPHHLNNLYSFCQMILEANKDKIIFYTFDRERLILNAAFLIGGYLIIYESKAAAWIHSQLTEIKTKKPKFKLVKFVDASMFSHKEISLLDALEGLESALSFGFFDFDDYDYEEYKYYEKVVNGDLNWIIPGKVLAFSGPHSHFEEKDGYPHLPPSHYFDYFRKNNVTSIVRLNMKVYNAHSFTNFGFEHHDLFFVDGTSPTLDIVYKFIEICDRTEGAVAVHCRAGLGRTGTLIACYLMYHWRFTAHEAIAWLRICRPGCVIGCQQTFLEMVEKKIMAEGESHRSKYKLDFRVFKYGIYSKLYKEQREKDIENANISEIDKNKNTKNHDGISISKRNKNDFVSLDTIINANSPMKTRSSTNQEKNKNNNELSKSIEDCMVKNSYPNHVAKLKTLCAQPNKSGKLIKVQETITPNKINTHLVKSRSLGPENNRSARLVKVQETTTPIKMSANVTTRLKTNNVIFTRSSAIMPTKSSLAKCRLTKNNTAIMENTRVLRRTNNENISSNNEPREIKPAVNTIPIRPLRKKSPRNSKSIQEQCDNTLSDLTLNTSRVNASNSDSELGSTNTTLTNISADSLENIPCKMTRNKRSSPEPMDQSSDIDLPNSEHYEDKTSQGNRLFEIKTKKYFHSSRSKDKMRTRSSSSSPHIKKK